MPINSKIAHFGGIYFECGGNLCNKLTVPKIICLHHSNFISKCMRLTLWLNYRVDYKLFLFGAAFGIRVFSQSNSFFLISQALRRKNVLGCWKASFFKLSSGVVTKVNFLLGI